MCVFVCLLIYLFVCVCVHFCRRYEKYLHKDDWEQIMEYSRLIHLQQTIEKVGVASVGLV